MRYLVRLNGAGDKERGFPVVIPWTSAQAKRSGEFAPISEEKAKVLLDRHKNYKAPVADFDEEVVTPDIETGFDVVDTPVETAPVEVKTQDGPATDDPFTQFKGDKKEALEWVEKEFSVALDGRRFSTMAHVEKIYEKLKRERDSVPVPGG